MTEAQKQRNTDIMDATIKDSIELGRIFCLIDMVENNEWPDGSFSDNEYCIWSALRQLAGSQK